MFALAGFGQEFPILVYVYERSEQEYEEMQLKYSGQLYSNVETTAASEGNVDEDAPQNKFHGNDDDQDSYGGYGTRGRALDSSLKRDFSRDALSDRPTKTVRFDE
jgi:hypothetical protein